MSALTFVEGHLNVTLVEKRFTKRWCHIIKTFLTLILVTNFKCDAGGLHILLSIFQSSTSALSVVTMSYVKEL